MPNKDIMAPSFNSSTRGANSTQITLYVMFLSFFKMRQCEQTVVGASAQRSANRTTRLVLWI